MPAADAVAPIKGASGGTWQIGRYRVVREIGRGTMGVVYLGHEPLVKRTVALKVAHERGYRDATPARCFALCSSMRCGQPASCAIPTLLRCLVSAWKAISMTLPWSMSKAGAHLRVGVTRIVRCQLRRRSYWLALRASTRLRRAAWRHLPRCEAGQ